MSDARKIAEGLTEAQRGAILDAKLDRWPGPTMIYRVWYGSTEDALALWRAKVVTEYTAIENWFSPLSDFGQQVRAILMEGSKR